MGSHSAVLPCLCCVVALSEILVSNLSCQPSHTTCPAQGTAQFMCMSASRGMLHGLRPDLVSPQASCTEGSLCLRLQGILSYHTHWLPVMDTAPCIRWFMTLAEAHWSSCVCMQALSRPTQLYTTLSGPRSTLSYGGIGQDIIGLIATQGEGLTAAGDDG